VEGSYARAPIEETWEKCTLTQRKVQRYEAPTLERMVTILAFLKAAAVLAGSVVLVGSAVIVAMSWLLNHPPRD